MCIFTLIYAGLSEDIILVCVMQKREALAPASIQEIEPETRHGERVMLNS